MNMNMLATYNRQIVIDVDPQIDFCPGGALGVTDGDKVMGPLNRINEAVYRNGGTVVVTGDQHPADTPHFDIWAPHCIAGTEGAKFHPDLVIRPGYLFIDKGTGQTNGYSGFEGVTRDGLTLEQIIGPENHNDRTAVILGGLATDYCVRATTLDALTYANRVRKAGRGVIDVYVATDAVRAVNLQLDDGENALKEVEAAGARLVTTAELIG